MMVKKCCDCKRINIDNHWTAASLINCQTNITHAYCPHCYRELMKRLRLYSGRLSGLGVRRREMETIQ